MSGLGTDLQAVSGSTCSLPEALPPLPINKGNIATFQCEYILSGMGEPGMINQTVTVGFQDADSATVNGVDNVGHGDAPTQSDPAVTESPILCG